MSLVIWHNRATLANFLFLNKNFIELKVNLYQMKQQEEKGCK